MFDGGWGQDTQDTGSIITVAPYYPQAIIDVINDYYDIFQSKYSALLVNANKHNFSLINHIHI